MKIVVTNISSKKGECHKIEVLDGQTVVHTTTADSIKHRDEAVWSLTELYNVVDVEIREAKEKKMKLKDFKYSEIPSIPVLDESGAEEFFEEEGDLVFDRIVTAIKEGMHTKIKEVRLFELNGTDSYLTAEKSTWKHGLDHALQHYIATEQYEKCPEVKQLMDKL